MGLRRELIECVDVVLPEKIEIGKRYTVKLKIKNIAVFWPTIYRYNYTVEGEKEEVRGSSETIIKGGEEREIEIEREAKKEEEHWEVELFRGFSPRNTLAEPQFTEVFDVPKEAVVPPGIEVSGFAITDPEDKTVYAGGEFTGKVTIRNKIAEHVSRSEVKTKITQNGVDLGQVVFTDVELDPDEELSKEQTLIEGVGEAGDYNVCAVLIG